MELASAAFVLSTIFMTGLVWFVQVIHYPLMKEVGEERFPNYEQRHVQLAGWLIVPVMLLELVTTLLVLITDINLLTITAAALLATIWFSTFVFQVPIHRKLEKKFSTRDIDKLIRSNWVRTLAWTLKSMIVLILLVK